MVFPEERASQLGMVIQDFPLLWDPSNEHYPQKNKSRGKRAKEEVRKRLCLMDEVYWTSFDTAKIMEQFRNIRKGFQEAQRKMETSRKTKSGQGAGSDDESGPGHYVHAEHFKFLEGTFGEFGSNSVTNTDLNSSILIDEVEESLSIASSHFEEQVEKEVKRNLLAAKRRRLQDEGHEDDEEDDSISILEAPPKTLKAVEGMKPKLSLSNSRKTKKANSLLSSTEIGKSLMKIGGILEEDKKFQENMIQKQQMFEPKSLADKFTALGQLVENTLRDIKDPREVTERSHNITNALFAPVSLHRPVAINPAFATNVSATDINWDSTISTPWRASDVSR